MGYVGGKIPGHSGTERKHKKVFARRNQWEGARVHTNATKREDAPLVGKYKFSYSEGLVYRRIKMIAGSAIILIILGMFWWMFVGFKSSLDIRPQAAETVGTTFTKEQTHAYNFLVKSGRKSLTIKDFRVAAYEFDQALKIAPYGKQARLGLLETLKEICAENPYYCDRVEEQLKFVQGMGWLEEE